MMWKVFLCVGAGSCVGGVLRYFLSKCVQDYLPAAAFPVGTLVVNVLGCFLIGFVGGLFEQGAWWNPYCKLFLTVGFCGGFTTFSTFLNENSLLLREEHFLSCCLYTGSSLFLGFVLLQVGAWIARAI